ncbi:MAG: sugar phosphate nucleotidyltransferase, partial [Defluviitaleaceae bacterium]|nr:sugar phosphate nucleotidyltransferase [Defluviitaleaceae bacterium]
LTLDRPKALLPLGGRPVIDYIVDQICLLPNVDAVYAVTNAKFYGHFTKWAAVSGFRLPIEILNDGTDSEQNRRGAIGDIIFTVDSMKIDDDLYIVAGDNYFTFDLREQYDFFRTGGCDTVCAGRIGDVKQLRQFAVATLDDSSRVLSLVEKPDDPPSDIGIYASYFYRRDTIPLIRRYLSEGNVPDAPGYFVEWLHKRKEVRAYVMNGECHDIGTIEKYDEINDLLNRK